MDDIEPNSELTSKDMDFQYLRIMNSFMNVNIFVQNND